MPKTCLKCGHINTVASDGPEAECPRCGAIYAKVEKALEERAAALAASASTQKTSVEKSNLLAIVMSLVAGALIISAVYSDHQTKVAKQHKAQNDAALRSAQEAAARLAREQERKLAAQVREKELAERRAAMTPKEIREEAIRLQFSIWDGSHNATEDAIKKRMHNPDSYKHVSTVYSDNGPGNGLTIHTKFRGTNAFGAVVTNIASAQVTESGQIVAIKMAPR